MILVVAILLICVVVFRGLCSLDVVRRDKAKGEAAFQDLKRNRDITMDQIAKEQDIYYNRVVNLFERDFHYDGTPKHEGAKPLSHR